MRYFVLGDESGATATLRHAGGECIARAAAGDNINLRSTRFYLTPEDAEWIMAAEGAQAVPEDDEKEEGGTEVYWVGRSRFCFDGPVCYVSLDS